MKTIGQDLPICPCRKGSVRPTTAGTPGNPQQTSLKDAGWHIADHIRSAFGAEFGGEVRWPHQSLLWANRCRPGDNYEKLLALSVFAVMQQEVALRKHELPPRKEPRQRRSAVTRQRILDASARVFGEYGYAAGTTNRIAEEADISIGSLYQYFPNKDSILVELMTVHVHSGVAITKHHLAGGLPDALEDIVRLFVRATIDNHREDPQLHRVLFEETPRHPDFLRLADESASGIVDLTQVLLVEHPEVRVTDTDTAARVVVATIESLVHRLIASPNPVEVTSFENEVTAMVTRYLRG
jgi:AcrR family transcriptional regulator